MNIEVQQVIVEARPGAAIGTCIKDALAMAIADNRTVVLRHNGRAFTCDPGEHFNLVWQTAKPPMPEVEAHQ